MRLRGGGAEGAAPDFHHHNRLFRRLGRRERGEEAVGFADALGVGGDDVGVRVFGHPADNVADGHVAFIAGGDHQRRADATVTHRGEDVAAIGAGLAGDADAAGDRPAAVEGGGEGGVERQPGVEQAEAVRPQQAHAGGPGDADHAGLRRRPGCIDLGKAGGQHDDVFHPARGQIGHRIDRDVRRNRDNRHIRHRRQIGHAGVAAQAQHFVAARINRVDRPGEALLAHQVDRPATDAGWLRGGAQHGHRVWAEHAGQAGKPRAGADCHDVVPIICPDDGPAVPGGASHPRPNSTTLPSWRPAPCPTGRYR